MPPSTSPGRVELFESAHSLPVGARALGRTDPQAQIELTVGVRRLAPLPELDVNPPSQRTYLSRTELAQRFGSDPAALSAIRAFAQAHHLRMTREEPAAARIGLAGAAADVCAAFGVTLFDYTHPQLGRFHARTGPVFIPQALAGQITGVFGLNNHRILRRRLVGSPVVPEMAASARSWFIPTELAPLYDFPQADTSAQCVGLLEFGGGVESADVTAYFKQIGVPAPEIAIVAAAGVSTDPKSDPESTGEVMLDIDVAGALAGGAKLAVYFSTFDEKGLIDCLASVVGDSQNDPSVVSVSWGWAENQPFNNSGVLWSPAAISHCDDSFLAAAHLGITFCVSTGDDGSEAQLKDGLAHVNYPATSPYVLAVGGTTLHAPAAPGGGTPSAGTLSEVVWNDGPDSGTGGGISDVTPVPAWQSGKVPLSINPGHFAGRAIPDVAANADPATGYLMRSGGRNQVVGGTSAAAPLWASLLVRLNALLGRRLGNINLLLYDTLGPQGVLRDITSGNNDTDGLLGGQFQAGPGWDACTGWGAPDGAKLLAALKAVG